MMLNPEQQAAVDSSAPKILCLAGAGTGKTQTMIQRISKLILDGISSDSMLVLTFTNAAAFEMRERFMRNHPELDVPEFRTFHSFCYSLIAKDTAIRKELGYTNLPKICDVATLKRIEQSVRLQCNIKLSEKILEGPSPKNPVEKYEYDLYHKSVRRALSRQGLITFDILCYDVCKLFSSKSEIVAYYAGRYKYIFVDEFQDTDPKQWEFVKSFENSNIFVVGDALQAIYSFRGADSTIIKKLSKSSEWETFKLYRNYRSNKNICDYANNMSTYADDSYRIEISSEKDGPDVTVISTTQGNKYRYVSSNTLYFLQSWLESHEEGSTAILCRTNKEVAEISDFCKEAEIPFTTGQQNDEAVKMIKSGRDNEYAILWLSTFLDSQKYSDWIRTTTLLPKDESPTLSMLSDFSKDCKPVQERIRKIYKLRKIMKDTELSATQKCEEVLKLFRLHRVTVDTDAETNEEIVEYLMNILGESSGASIYVGTIHSSKGLEYDNVFLMNVGSYTFSLKTEENKNLYYVGITRARENLAVCKSV